MLSGFKPVTLPVTNDEVAMVTRRQKALTAEINKIASMVRSGAYSSTEGRDRSAFLRGEIANLEQYKRARRTTGTTSWKPAPRPETRANKPANKYVAPPPAKPPRITPPQGKIDTGKAAPVHPMQNPYGKKYFGPSGNPGTNEITYGMKKDTAGVFYRHEETIGNVYSKRKVFTWYGPNFGGSAVSTNSMYSSAARRTIDSWAEWNKIHFGKYWTHKFSVPKSKPAPPPVTPTSTAKKTVKSNPYGRNYGPNNNSAAVKMYADAVRDRAGGARPIKDGRYWYGPKAPNYRKSWEAWNNKYVYGTSAPKSTTKSPTTVDKPKTIADKAKEYLRRKKATSGSKTTTPKTTTPKKTVRDNPHTYRRTTTGYGAFVTSYEQSKMNYALKSGNNTITRIPKAIKVGKYWYGPTDGSEILWINWMKANKLPYSSGRKTTTPKPKFTVKDNKHGYSYGPSISNKEKLRAKYRHGRKWKYAKPIKYFHKNGITYYGPRNGKEKEWLAWNNKHKLNKFGVSPYDNLGGFKPHQRRTMDDSPINTGEEGRARMHREVALREESNRVFQVKRQEELAIRAAAEELAREKAKENELRLKQQHRIPPQRGRPIQRGSRIAPARMPPPHMIREETMMRKRAGATITFERPAPKSSSQSWEQGATKQEKQAIQFLLSTVGLQEMPKLSEKGNQLLTESLRVSQIKNPQQKEKEMINHFNRTITELVNNSGYFAVKYRVEANPKGKQIKMTEMAGIAGGFTKTRNSMQGLLRQ